jgi:hypothetical protein
MNQGGGAIDRTPTAAKKINVPLRVGAREETRLRIEIMKKLDVALGHFFNTNDDDDLDAFCMTRHFFKEKS